MRKFIVIAILALIGSTAAAEAKVHQFKFGGRVVRFEVPKNCKKISCIQTNVKEKSSKADKSESVAATAAPVAAAPLAAAAVDSPKATTPAPSVAPPAPFPDAIRISPQPQNCCVQKPPSGAQMPQLSLQQTSPLSQVLGPHGGSEGSPPLPA